MTGIKTVAPHGTIFLVSDCVFPLYDSLKAAPIPAFPELKGRSRAAWWRRLDGPESHNELRNSEPANPNAINQGSGEGQSREEQMEERRKIRRLQLMMDMVMSVIGQDPNLTVDEAAEMVADSRRAALAMFPDKELAYNILYKPRLQRLMRERYRIQ